jgi:hypothetical protein
MSVMPTFQGADPRLFNPYGSLSEGLTGGIRMADEIQQMKLKRAMEDRAIEQMQM